MLRKILNALFPPSDPPHTTPTVGIFLVPFPPTAREALGTSATKQEAIAYNRSRVATACALQLFWRGKGHPRYTPVTDLELDEVVRQLGFPYSRPSPETRAAIRAALAVVRADIRVSH